MFSKPKPGEIIPEDYQFTTSKFAVMVTLKTHKEPQFLSFLDFRDGDIQTHFSVNPLQATQFTVDALAKEVAHSVLILHDTVTSSGVVKVTTNFDIMKETVTI